MSLNRQNMCFPYQTKAFRLKMPFDMDQDFCRRVADG